MARHQVPPLTAVEREDHRLRAIEARKQRARMLGGVREGRVDPAGVLMRRDRVAMRTRTADLLAAVPGMGRARVPGVMRALRIAPDRRLGGLGCRQRDRLVSWLASRED